MKLTKLSIDELFDLRRSVQKVLDKRAKALRKEVKAIERATS